MHCVLQMDNAVKGFTISINRLGVRAEPTKRNGKWKVIVTKPGTCYGPGFNAKLFNGGLFSRLLLAAACILNS